MDKKAVSYTTVGIFVAIGFVAFVYIVFTMGGGTGFLSSNIKLFGRFRDVKGLHSGSEVSLSGLRIGVVKDIRVAPDDTKELIVEFSVGAKYREQIKTDSTATVKTQGVLGDKYVELSIGTSGLPSLSSGDQIATSEPPDLFSKSGNLVEGISKYFKEGGNLDSLLKNLSELSINLASLTGQIKREKSLLNELFYGTSGQNLHKAMGHLDSILAKIDSGEGTLGSLVNDPTVYEDMKSLMGGAKRSNILRYFMKQFIDSGEKEKEKASEKKKAE